MEEDGRDAVAGIGAVGSDKKGVDTGWCGGGRRDRKPDMPPVFDTLLCDAEHFVRDAANVGDREIQAGAGGDVDDLCCGTGFLSLFQLACGKLNGVRNSRLDHQLDRSLVANKSDVQGFAQQSSMRTGREGRADDAGFPRSNRFVALRIHFSAQAPA